MLCFLTSDENDVFSVSRAVEEAGRVGLIYAQSRNDELASCAISCVKVDYEIGTQILSYIRRAR